ncbi:nucleoside-diphosphate kinase [bacterium]|nr:nucleoside-diphosphate kinase [bacterium]
MERTLMIIKPDAVRDGHIGDILQRVEKEGFQIRAMRMLRLEQSEAEDFYGVHREKPFFESLVKYMISGKIIVAALFRENAVEYWRKVIGNTNPEKSEEGTIRKLFGKSIESNAVHGSDSLTNGQKETDFFFEPFEYLT